MDKAFSTTLSWIMHWFSDKILNPSIIPTEAQCIVHLYQKQPSGQSFFKGAGPVGAVLCLAESTIRIATRGRESTPPPLRQASIQEWQCVQPPRPMPDRSNPSNNSTSYQQKWPPQCFHNTVRGYQNPFRELSPNSKILTFTFTEKESKLISAEVGELLHKQAISQTVSDGGFISNILVPKGKGWSSL